MTRPFFFLLATTLGLVAAQPNPATSLDPLGRRHIPIGTIDTVDALKTFVEAEGSFSPGFGTFGVYFWIWDKEGRRLIAPTQNGVRCEQGLDAGGALIPWTRWEAGTVQVTTEVCQIERQSDSGAFQVVGARVHLANPGRVPLSVSLYVALRPLGPAGGPITSIKAVESKDALIANGFPAIVAREPAFAVGVLTNDTIASWATLGNLPIGAEAKSSSGDCSGALVYEIQIEPGQTRSLGFVCPVWPGRRVQGHRWDGTNSWAQLDLNPPVSRETNGAQPSFGELFYRLQSPDALVATARSYWRDQAGRVGLQLPDVRWGQAFHAIAAHSALCLNEGAPDVAVVNYNVFNRDGIYLANILQKAGNFDLAERAIDYFLQHPFNGRVEPEADNPGQILWILGEHWKFTRSSPWLIRIYPVAQKIAAMIRYYRTTPGPHWVSPTSLDFGSALPTRQRRELKPGACDGFHPEYTEAFDIAGLRAAVVLATAAGQTNEATAWKSLSEELLSVYERKFGTNLLRGYGSYAVLWPCRLFPFDEGKAWEQCKDIGAQAPIGWRYFPLARAHQGLIAGNRDAGNQTIQLHLDQEQVRGWFALDEGGPSGVGGWTHARTKWPISPLPSDRQILSAPAMPHGWANAEFHLLLRDCLVYETDDQLVLFAGIPLEWFSRPEGISVDSLPTHFGRLSLTWSPMERGARLTLAGDVSPPEGFLLRLPESLKAKVTIGGTEIELDDNNNFDFAAGSSVVEIRW